MGLVALDAYLSPGEQIVIVGKKEAPETSEMLKTVWQKFLPGAVWALINDEASRVFFAKQAEFYKRVQTIDGKPTAFVCKNFVCNLPTTDLELLKKELSALKETTTRGDQKNK
jgi:uncharacterized protein YyaL (SSP411 family)